MDINLLFGKDNCGGSLIFSLSEKPFRYYILGREDIIEIMKSINKNIDYNYTDGEDTFLLSPAKKTMTFNIKKNNQTIVFRDEYEKIVGEISGGYYNFTDRLFYRTHYPNTDESL